MQSAASQMRPGEKRAINWIAFRVIYVASLPDQVAVLHAFRKKSGKTRKPDLDLARRALKELQRRNNS
jgi:phage-related protein